MTSSRPPSMTLAQATKRVGKTDGWMDVMAARHPSQKKKLHLLFLIYFDNFFSAISRPRSDNSSPASGDIRV